MVVLYKLYLNMLGTTFHCMKDHFAPFPKHVHTHIHKYIYIWRFPKIGLPQFSSIYKWIFHEINNPAIGVPPHLWKPNIYIYVVCGCVCLLFCLLISLRVNPSKCICFWTTPKFHSVDHIYMYVCMYVYIYIYIHPYCFPMWLRMYPLVFYNE